MASIVFMLLLYVIESLFVLSKAYRLNVPRVLLPYHPSNQVQYQLKVTDPDNGCFTWRSSRTEIVSVEALDSGNVKGCSDRAIITSRSRNTDQQSVVIFAEEQGGGQILSCDVTVDLIHSIMISTTTKVLFVDAAPVLLEVEGFNKEGDRFSSLGNIPFEWFFEYNDGRPLHIVPFAQSKYEASPGIEELERQKKKGNVILVEGVSTGSAQLSAKFSELYFSHIPVNSIELFVLANVMLVPSYDLYLPLFSVVKYGAVQLRKNRQEVIRLPSNQYQLKLDNSSVCELDVAKSLVTAAVLGSTEITLIDNVMKPRVEFKPRSARIFVVEPNQLQFTISRGDNWHLQLNVEYEINVKLTDQLGNAIYIPDNAVFATKIQTTHFEILERSKNGTYFRVVAKRAGKLNIQSALTTMITASGREIKVDGVRGEQLLEILTPVVVEPQNVLFPFQSLYRYEFQMKASGGSGHYHWSSVDSSIAQIDEKTGRLSSGRLGETTVTAQDAYNNLNRATAKVTVTEPFDMQFAPSPVEAEIGSSLTLRIKLLGQTPAGLVPFTDCRHFSLPAEVADPSVFIVDDKVKPVVPEGKGCTTINLYAVREGNTQLTLKNNRFKASIDVSAYPPLKINVKSALLLALGSGIGVTFDGGPRPWVLDNTKYTTSVTAKNVNAASALIDGNKSFKAFCRNQIIDTDVILTISNRPTVENPMPAMATAKLRLCCSVPTHLALTIPRMSHGELPVCPAFSHSTYFNAPFRLVLNAQGRCAADKPSEARSFDSINSLNVEYETNKKMLRIEKIADDSIIQSSAAATGTPRGVTGPVEIEAVVEHFYDLASATPTQRVAFPNAEFRAALTLNLVDFARANPSAIVLWNDKSVKGHVRITGGSGHFWLDATAAVDRVTASLHGKDTDTEIEILPKSTGASTLTLFDLCIEGSRMDIEVKVADISGVQLETTDFVKTGGVVGMKVAILDADQRPFIGADLNDIHVTLSPTGPTPQDGIAHTVELVLRNLATRQVVRFPINLKLVSEVVLQQRVIFAGGGGDHQQTAVVPAGPMMIGSHTETLHEIRDVVGAFFHGYQTFVLSTSILLITVLVFAAAYRYGYLSPILKGPSSGKFTSGVSTSFMADTYRVGGKPVFGERPTFHSTSAFDDSGTLVSPLLRNSALSLASSSFEEAAGGNASRHSAGSDDDPYLWTSKENSRMQNSSLINRRYK